MARQADAILKEIIGQLSIQFAVAQAGLEAANEEIAKLKLRIEGAHEEGQHSRQDGGSVRQ